MKNLTVLITAAGVPFMPGLVNCLRNNGERNIKIIGTDMNQDFTIAHMVDVFYRTPPVSSDDYTEVLLKLCKENKVDILIPFMSQELLQLKENEKRFNEIGTILSVASEHVIAITNNKYLFYCFLKQNGLSVPKFFRVRSLKELENAMAEIGYPKKAVCVKLAESSGSRGVRIIDPKISRFSLFLHEKPNSLFISFQELLSVMSEVDSMPEMMVMEYLPGKEVSVDLLAEEGKILYMCGRESNIISASIPLEATLREDRAAYEICTKVTQLLQISGNADFDFKYNEEGKPVLMEVNPRIAATMAVFLAGGLNLPYLRIKQLLGETLPAVKINYGVKMKRRYLEQFTAQDGTQIEIGSI